MDTGRLEVGIDTGNSEAGRDLELGDGKRLRKPGGQQTWGLHNPTQGFWRSWHGKFSCYWVRDHLPSPKISGTEGEDVDPLWSAGSIGGMEFDIEAGGGRINPPAVRGSGAFEHLGSTDGGARPRKLGRAES